MNTFLKLPATDRRLAFQQVESQLGLQAVSVEKDFWVCWTLRTLFAMPGVGDHLTFKGGTSLSKAWKLIQRFSEDIDLIVDKNALGFGGDAAPDRASSNNKRRERLEKLMEASRQWVQGTLQPALRDNLKSALGEAGWNLEVDPDVADGQCLLFHYLSVFATTSAGYVRPVVKIELGARSDDWPHETIAIQPYVLELFPVLDRDAGFSPRNGPSGRRRVCCTRKRFVRWTSRLENRAWPATTTTFGASCAPGWARVPWPTPRFSSASPNIGRFYFAIRGWIIRRTSQARSACCRPKPICPTGATTTKKCSVRCSSARFPTSPNSCASLPSLKRPSTKPRYETGDKERSSLKKHLAF